MRRDYLAQAVLGQRWATSTLSRANAEDWSLNRLYTALDADLNMTKMVAAKKSGHKSNTVKTKSVLYQAPGTYAHPRAPGSKSSAPYGPRNGKPSPGRFSSYRSKIGSKPPAYGSFKGNCRNCQKPGHMWKQCKEPLSAAVLYEIMYEEEDEPTDTGASTSAEDEAPEPSAVMEVGVTENQSEDQATTETDSELEDAIFVQSFENDIYMGEADETDF